MACFIDSPFHFLGLVIGCPPCLLNSLLYKLEQPTWKWTVLNLIIKQYLFCFIIFNIMFPFSFNIFSVWQNLFASKTKIHQINFIVLYVYIFLFEVCIYLLILYLNFGLGVGLAFGDGLCRRMSEGPESSQCPVLSARWYVWFLLLGSFFAAINMLLLELVSLYPFSPHQLITSALLAYLLSKNVIKKAALWMTRDLRLYFVFFKNNCMQTCSCCFLWVEFKTRLFSNFSLSSNSLSFVY